MKSTTCTHTGERVIVAPLIEAGAVMVSVFNRNTAKPGTPAQTAFLTPDQCGALIFGIEQALEVLDQRRRKALEVLHAGAAL